MKADGLTDREKMECTVRWLNFLYSSYYRMLVGDLIAEEFLKITSPCGANCPYWDKCPCVALEPDRPTVPIPMNFKVLEQFTPGLSVAGPVFSLTGTQYKDNGLQSE